MSNTEQRQGGLPEVDVQEHGAERDGQPQTMNRRLFMQLTVFRCPEPDSPREYQAVLEKELTKRQQAAVLYADVNDPRSIGVLAISEQPGDFIERLRPIFETEKLRRLELRPELTMLGRTYSSGHEHDLVHWLIDRPRSTALNEAWPWAVWYPLRRGGAFAKLEAREQGRILREHAVIGRAYGAKDLAHDVRLACHGLDQNDNEFVIGLVGKDLHPLSHVVQSMRKTRQTSEFIVQMGPFFVGHALWRYTGAES